MDEPNALVWQARIAAALGRRSGALQIASFGVALVACVSAVANDGKSLTGILVPQAIMASIGLALGFRTALDADFFAALAIDQDAAAFDRAMLSLGLMPPGKTGRTMAERAGGLIRLLRWQAGALAVQMAFAVLSLLTLEFAR